MSEFWGSYSDLLRAPGAVIKLSSRENEKCVANPSSAAQSGSVGNWGSLESAEDSRRPVPSSQLNFLIRLLYESRAIRSASRYWQVCSNVG